ncbi:MAG: oligosaccharide flippase family protein [Patescibacteria group bacterium]
MNTYRKFARDVGMMGIVEILMNLKGVVLLPIITKSITVENYGIWTQFSTTLSLLTPFVLLGLHHALIRFLPAIKLTEEVRQQFWSIVGFVSLLSCILLLLFTFFALPLSEAIQTPPSFVLLLGFVLLFGAVDILFLNFFRAFQEIGKFSVFQIFTFVGDITLIGASVSIGYGAYGAVVSMLAVRMLSSGGMLFLVLKKIGFSVPKFSLLKEYLSFGLPTIINSIAYWIVQVSDRYLIAAFLGIAFVGYYAPAYSFGTMLNLFIFPVTLSLAPVISKLFASQQMEEIKTYLSFSLKYILAVMIPAVFGLSTLSRQLLRIFSTEEIASNASFIIPLVAASFLLYGIHAVVYQVLGLYKKMKLGGLVWLGAAFLNFFLNLIFIPRIGILGAALTTFLAYLVALSLIWYTASRYLSFPVDFVFIGKSLLSAFLMTLILMAFPPEGMLQTFGAIFLGALFYLLSMLFFKAFTKKELTFFLTLWKKER